MTIRIATWNVNSLKIRLPQVLDWLAASNTDVLCLQETKITDDRFPAATLAESGYVACFAGQPAYNGVAILSRRATTGEIELLNTGNPHFPDEQKRLISAEVAGVTVVCAYFPNGQALDSDKFRYKLAWIDALQVWLEDLRQRGPVVLTGDFNIAPEDRDVHDPVAWADQLHCSEPERERFRRLLAAGFDDAFRLFEQPPGLYSWWDYRQLAFRRNAGLRIDHMLTDVRLKARVRACSIDKAPRKREQPSDHTPVIVDLD
jgi:exodeoxyribonuclease-3